MTPAGGVGGRSSGPRRRRPVPPTKRPAAIPGHETGEPATNATGSLPVTITTTAPHGRTLEALSRAATLLREHREEIPPVIITVAPNGRVKLQVTAADTFDEATRVAAVDRLAELLHLDPPKVIDTQTYSTGAASNVLWTVFTFVRDTKCPTCQKPVVR